jgi:hypothetical protein
MGPPPCVFHTLAVGSAHCRCSGCHLLAEGVRWKLCPEVKLPEGGLRTAALEESMEDW